MVSHAYIENIRMSPELLRLELQGLSVGQAISPFRTGMFGMGTALVCTNTRRAEQHTS